MEPRSWLHLAPPWAGAELEPENFDGPGTGAELEPRKFESPGAGAEPEPGNLRKFRTLVGDLILISVGAEFKRCLFVGQTKYNKTFKPYYDSNNVVVFNDDGSPSGTRILAPIPSWFRDPKEIKKIEQQANKIGWDVQMSKVLAICPQFVW